MVFSSPRGVRRGRKERVVLKRPERREGFLFDREERFIVAEAVGTVENAEGVFQGAEGIAELFSAAPADSIAFGITPQ
jgi:hypothetical protein